VAASAPPATAPVVAPAATTRALPWESASVPPQQTVQQPPLVVEPPQVMPWEQPESEPSLSVPVTPHPALSPAAIQASAEPVVAESRGQFDFGQPSSDAPAFTPSFAPAPTTASGPTAPARSAAGLIGNVVSWVLGFAVGFFVSRAMAPKAPTATGLEAIKDFGQRSGAKAWPSPKAEVPSKQKVSLGATVQVGNLAVTPVKVERRKVVKVHFSGNKETVEQESLVLRVKFRNTSSDLSFVPIDENFLRENKEAPVYSFIDLGDGATIGMFDLSEFSEFSIEGQPFDEIVPGQEVEALIAAAEGSPAQIKGKGKMVWRILVRTGAGPNKAYTSVVGVEFSDDQVQAG